MLTHAESRPFTVEEYYRMAEVGVLGPEERVELVDGKVVPLSPHNPRHSRGVERCTRALTRLYSSTHAVRVQLPLRLDETNEPEPDLALVLEAETCPDRHPTRADLILEVSDTSLAYDRHDKSSMYARAGILDCWILNLPQQQLEVHRVPTPDPAAAFGWRYAEVSHHGPGEQVAPLFRADLPVAVAELLS